MLNFCTMSQATHPQEGFWPLESSTINHGRRFRSIRNGASSIIINAPHFACLRRPWGTPSVKDSSVRGYVGTSPAQTNQDRTSGPPPGHRRTRGHGPPVAEAPRANRYTYGGGLKVSVRTDPARRNNTATALWEQLQRHGRQLGSLSSLA